MSGAYGRSHARAQPGVGGLDARAGSQPAVLLQRLGRAQQLDRHDTTRQIDRLLSLQRAGGTMLDGFAAIVTGG